MNATEVQSHLEHVKDCQFAFKSTAVESYACEAVARALRHGVVWPDEVPIGLMSEDDRNCIGPVWRWVAGAGIWTRNGEWRRSEAEGAKGRTIFQYVLLDEGLGNLFLTRRGRARVDREILHQGEMAL
jgi:hypothetical protein